MGTSGGPDARASARRGGFTLVELLVSVALVLLIMSLFAQAFGIAAGAIRTQRGIAENDQRARSMQTILLGDLEKASYRQRDDAVAETINPAGANGPEQQLIALQNTANRNSLGIVPLHPDYFNGGNGGDSIRNVDQMRERGYFYFSEGDPLDDSDDVLQFTVDISQTELGNVDTTPLIGRARLILTPDSPPGTPTWPTWNAPPPATPNAPNNIDQPIWDDGKGFQQTPAGATVSYQPGETGATKSRYAEISYFIRNGRLHRRVLLIRDPLGIVAGPPDTGQPNTLNGDITNPVMITGFYDLEDGSPPSAGTSDFWNDFDSSATFTANAASGVNVFFSEIASLDNTTAGVQDTTPPPATRFMALGNPRNRFGHHPFGLGDPIGSPGGLQGRPKEHYDPANPSSFFGRFTHEETSHWDFRFPGFPDYANGGTATGVSPFAAVTLAGITDGNNDQITDAFTGGPREGEDILLSNCHAFDIKVWDDELRQFVDIGHTLTDTATNRGDYHAKQVLDTSQPWNPTPGTNNPGRFQAAQQGMARYGSLNGQQNRVFDTWHPAFNFDTNRVGGPAGAQGPADDVPPYRPLWSERDSFGASVRSGGSGGGPGVPPGPYLTGLTPQFYDPAALTNADGYAAGERVFPRPDQTTPFRGHQSFYYVATPNAAIPGLDTTSMIPGDTSGATDPPWPEVSGGSVEDGQIIWKAIPNTIGLQAIQISVRFYDPTSGQFRQLTLTHSFVELEL